MGSQRPAVAQVPPAIRQRGHDGLRRLAVVDDVVQVTESSAAKAQRAQAARQLVDTREQTRVDLYLSSEPHADTERIAPADRAIFLGV